MNIMHLLSFNLQFIRLIKIKNNVIVYKVKIDIVILNQF